LKLRSGVRHTKGRKWKRKIRNIGGAEILLTTLLSRRKVMRMKEAYEQKLEAQLDEWSAEIDKLKAKADSADADAQLEYYKKIEELRSMQEAATNKLTELKEAGDDAWEDLKAGIDSAWDSLGNALKTAASRFK
jgi:predicted RNase H-like nuclease (RuvC/YqgF family)